MQSSIRELAELKRETILSPSLNPNGNRFSSEKGADQIVVKQLSTETENNCIDIG